MALSLRNEGPSKGPINACKQSFIRWGIRAGACLALTSLNFCKSCEQDLDDADASNVGLFQNSELQTFKIMPKYGWPMCRATRVTMSSESVGLAYIALRMRLVVDVWRCEQTVGNGWSCPETDFIRWAQTVAHCRPHLIDLAGRAHGWAWPLRKSIFCGREMDVIALATVITTCALASRHQTS